jgi:hypothetical protein
MPKQTKKPNFDPIEVLRGIAADPKAGATARVQAAKFLAQHDPDDADTDKGQDAPPSDAVTKRALKLLRGGKQ